MEHSDASISNNAISMIISTKRLDISASRRSLRRISAHQEAFEQLALPHVDWCESDAPHPGVHQVHAQQSGIRKSM